ncbi:MAG: amidohydrolase family protein [Thermoplasmata archaeon]
MSILIKNGFIVTQNKNRDIFEGDVYIEGNRIMEIGKNLHNEADYMIDASENIIVPGLINTHTHVGMGGFRGLIEDMQLDDFLKKTFDLDSKRTNDDIYHSSMISIAEMLRNGITSFLDLYYSEDIIARAVKDSGIRGFLSWVTLDERYTTQSGSPINNAENFIIRFKGSERIYPSVGFQGVYVCSDETMMKGKEIAEKHNTLMHMHLSETRKEVYDFLKRTNKRPVEHLYDIGFLNDKLIAAHTVWITIREIKMLGEKMVSSSHNSVSNMKLGTGGAAPIPEMIKYGVNVTLGTDSNTTNNNLDLFDVMKTSGLLHKNERWDASILKSQEIFDMATINAAKALKMEKYLGSIEEGKLADIAIIDPYPNGIPLRKETIIPNLVYAIKGLNVKTTIVDGKIVMNDGKLTLYNIEKSINFFKTS